MALFKDAVLIWPHFTNGKNIICESSMQIEIWNFDMKNWSNLWEVLNSKQITSTKWLISINFSQNWREQAVI